MKNLTFLFLVLFATAVFGQEFKLGDPKPFDSRFGLDGSPDSSKLISLNGEWQLLSGNNPVSVRVPFSTITDEPIKLQRIFRVPSKLANYQFRLEFLGIGQDASVALNGEFLALGRGADALIVDIPPNQLRYDTDNTLEVELRSDVLRKDDFPLAANFYTPKRYTGLFRDVYLLALPQRRIEGLDLSAETTNNGGRLQINYIVRDAKPLPSYAVPAGFPTTLQLRWMLTPYSSDEVIASNTIDIEVPSRSIKQGSIAYNLTNVQSWSPFQPNLYKFTVRLFDQEQMLHEVIDFIGFKDIRLSATGFTNRNGVPIKITAATYVEEFSETGWAATSFQLERDILAAKSLGLNTLRVIGKLPHPYLMRLADRYGLWILVDAPITIPPYQIVRKEEFRQYISTVLRQFTQRAGNHPSLLAVGPGFGFPTEGLDEELASMLSRIRHETRKWVYLSTPKPLQERVADFQIWEQLPNLSSTTITLPTTSGPILTGTVGIILDPMAQKGSDPSAEMRQSLGLIRSLEQDAVKASAGFVLSGLIDYQTHYPLLNRTPDITPYTLPVGVITFQRSERTTFVTIRDYLNGISVKPAPVGVASGTSSTSFIVAGLVILILFAFSIGQNKVLRTHVVRSMLHPGGFFTDVRDGRFFQFGETVIVGILLALIISSLGAATIFGLRHDYSFDVFLTVLLGNPLVKVWANRIIWNPPGCIAFLFILVTVVGVIFATLLSLVSMFTRQRIGVSRAISYITWGFVNHLLLLPLTLILVGSLSEKSISSGWVVVGFIFLAWSLYRTAAAILTAFRNTAQIASVLLVLLLSGIGVSLWYWLFEIKSIGMLWTSFRAAGW